jgi:DNA-binding NarL/FixJ family response regulator
VPVTVVLAEDHQIVRQGIRALLDREGFEVVAEASNGQEAVQITHAHKPEIAVLDVGMPIMNGLDAAQEINRTAPSTKTILLTRHDDDQYVLAALKAGVRGYVLKSQATFDLVQAIREVNRGGYYLSPGVSRTVIDAFLTKSDLGNSQLTARERQVLQLISEGRTTKEVATVLGVSVKTAESHRTRLMQKLDIHATAGLVRYAIRHGLIEP